MKRLFLSLALMASTITLYPMLPQDEIEYNRLSEAVAIFNAQIPSENFDSNAQKPESNRDGAQYLFNNVHIMFSLKSRMLRLLNAYPHDPRLQIFRSICDDIDTYLR